MKSGSKPAQPLYQTSSLRDSEGAGRFCRSSCAPEGEVPPADRPGLSIDAHQPRGRASRGELGRRPPRLVRGEVVGLRKDRSEASLRALLTTRLEARQRAAVDAVCTDLHRPYVNVVAEVMPRAKIVFRQISRAATRGRRAR